MKKTLQWIAGIIFLIAGITSLSYGGLGILSAILLIIASLICLPPTLIIIENKLNTKIKTSTKYILVIVFWVSGVLTIPKQETLKGKNIAKSSSEDVIEKKDTIIPLKTRLENNIKGLTNDNFTDIKDYTTANQFMIISAYYKFYAITIKEAKKSKDSEIIKLNNELIKKVSQSQLKNFPKIREKYFEFIKQKLWENDVYVSLSGSRNTNLKFTGAYFATNRNIQTTQEALSEMLNLLRFKQTQYCWYKGQDDYQYYTIQSEKDSEITE